MGSRDTIDTSSASETGRAGALLGALARPDDVIGLIGGLGAGKTVFAQGLAEGLGVDGPVPSPTFNLLLVHRGARLPFFHFDLYRLERPEELVDIDFREALESGGVAAVEWADRFPSEMPGDRLDVAFAAIDETHRSLTPCATGPRGRDLARRWLEVWQSEVDRP